MGGGSIEVEGYMAHPRFAGLVRALAGGFLGAQQVVPRLVTQFASQQRCLISHAALASYFRGLLRGKPGLTQRDFVENALTHNLSSRNTAAAFFAEALYYGLIRVSGPDRGRASIAEPAPETLWGMCEWYRLHLAVIDGLDGGSRAAIMQSGGVPLLAAVEPVVADALLASPLIRNPPSTYAVFASVDEGGSLMDRLIAGSDPAADGEERAVTDVTSVSALAKPFNISRTHAGRTLANAIAIGAIGWTGAPGRSPLWLSRAFREDYARVQATKLEIIAAAFDAATAGAGIGNGLVALPPAAGRAQAECPAW
jgi:hypothetical protein